MATTPEIQAKRGELEQATSDVVTALWNFEQASDDLRQKQRTVTGSDLAALKAEVADKQGLYDAARTHEAEVAADLLALTTAFLPMPAGSGGPTDQAAFSQELDALEATAPIVLLPVRLETRFEGSTLKVRVYPDEIFMNMHEVALTLEEQAAAKNYYETLNQEDNEKALWRDMVTRFGVERSAYILREMLPVFGPGGSSSLWFASSVTCGGTVFGGTKNPDLFFPEVQTRSSTWTRPGRATLPDRWAFITYRGSERKVKLGAVIPEPLDMTADPKLSETGEMVPLNGDYAIAEDLEWTVSFDRAVQVGMAIAIDDAAAGFDRLIVVGVKSSMSSLDTSLYLERLFDAHHYTRGAAIVRQGSPTNNTEGQETPYPPKDEAGELSYGIERQRAPLDREFSHHCLPPDTDGHYLAMALGVPSGVFANVDRAYQHEIEHAKHMNQVLWPGTFGFYLRHLFYMPAATTQVFTPERLANAKSYFRNFVLARGPAPAFRVGGTPYAVLPITALDQWQPRNYLGDDTSDEGTLAGIEGALHDPLLSLLEAWKASVSNVPRIRSDQNNPDVDVARVLSTYPSAREFRVRFGESDNAAWAKHTLFGIDITAFFTDLDQQTSDTLNLIGYQAWRPRIGRTVFQPDAALYSGDVVAPLPLSEDTGLNPNFIAGIGSASIEQLNLNQGVLNAPANPNLLYAVLRHSTLMEYWREHAETNNIDWIGWDIFGIPSIAIAPFISSMYDLETPPDISAHLNSLAAIAYESTAELERLFTETLDLSSHRLDAWLTAFASRRLDDMRRSQISTQLKPVGDFLGGYGWLENLKPATRPTQEVDGVGTVETQPGTGGFIHAPSMTHASAAAVLRNGHISFKQENSIAYAVDLSSNRVRRGRKLFEGVRNGQPVGALLGYELERALQDGYAGVERVNQLRFTLRSLYPLVANKSGQDGSEPAESIAARNVVDGARLLSVFESPAGVPYGTNGLPTPGSALQGILDFELGRLSELYDAAADLLTAEGAFQLVSGNVDAAVPTLNNVTLGKQPPDTVVSRSARRGTGISHLVALVFEPDSPPALPAGWPSTATPRAQAEPLLNAWLGQLVGDPAQIEVIIKYFDANGGVITVTDESTSTVLNQATVKLSELGLHPVDLLVIAEVVAKEGQGSLLDRRFVDVALNDPNRQPDTPPARIDVSYASGSQRTVPAIVEVLNTASAVLGASRALAPKDLVSPAEIDDLLEKTEGDGTTPDDGAVDLRTRADTASAQFGALTKILGDALNAGSGYRDALRQVSLYLTVKVFPTPTVADADLRGEVQSGLDLVNKQLAALPSLAPANTPRTALVASATAVLKAIFGETFVPLAALDPPHADELDLSLGARSTLLKLEGSGPSDDLDDEAPDRYLAQIMRVRERLGRFRKLNLYARTAGVGRARTDIVQLPYVPGERWLGLPYVTQPDEGRSAFLLLNYTSGLDASTSWAGLVLDDWMEAIPNQTEETGIALHYDSPRAQAPQALLVATPAKDGANWSFDELVGALEQTMDLMKVRAVDRDFLPVGQILPASVFATNANVNNVVSTAVEPLVMPPDTEPLQDG